MEQETLELGDRVTDALHLENEYAKGYAGYTERVVAARVSEARVAANRAQWDRWHATHEHVVAPYTNEIGICQVGIPADDYEPATCDCGESDPKHDPADCGALASWEAAREAWAEAR